MLWKDGYRRQRNRRCQPGRGPNPHPGEHDVADNTGINLGHQGNKCVPISAQPVNQIGFVQTAECRFINGENGTL